MKHPRLFVASMFVLLPWWLHGETLKTVAAERTVISPAASATTTVATDSSSRSADLRIKQAELAGLELSRNSLLQTISSREAEKAALDAHSDQEWEKARLPVTTKLLAESKAALAETETRLNSVRHDLAVLQKTSPASQTPASGPTTATTAANTPIASREIQPGAASGLEAQLTELKKQLAENQTILSSILAKIRDSGTQKDKIVSVNTGLMNAETAMIQLQAVISKQATMIQTITGMVQSLNESQKQVAGNIGR